MKMGFFCLFNSDAVNRVVISCLWVQLVLVLSGVKCKTWKNGLRFPFLNSNNSNTSYVKICCKYGGYFTTWSDNCCDTKMNVVCTRVCHSGPVSLSTQLNTNTIKATLPFHFLLQTTYTLTTHDNYIKLELEIKPGLFHAKSDRILLDFISCVKTTTTSATPCVRQLVKLLQKHSSENTTTFNLTSPNAQTTASFSSSTISKLKSSFSSAELKTTTQLLSSTRSYTTSQHKVTSALTLEEIPKTTSHQLTTRTAPTSTTTAALYHQTNVVQNITSESTPSTSTLTLSSVTESLTTSTMPATSVSPTTTSLLASEQLKDSQWSSKRILIGVVVGVVLTGVMLVSVIIVLYCILRNKRKSPGKQDDIYNDNVQQKKAPRPVDNPLYNLSTEDELITSQNSDTPVTSPSNEQYQTRHVFTISDDVISVNDNDYATIRQLGVSFVLTTSVRSSSSGIYDTLNHVIRKDRLSLADCHVYNRPRDLSGEYDRLKIK